VFFFTEEYKIKIFSECGTYMRQAATLKGLTHFITFFSSNYYSKQYDLSEKKSYKI
jgi:hypothetical protein